MDRAVSAHDDAEAGGTVIHYCGGVTWNDRYAVALDLRSSKGEQITGGQAVARQKPLHVCGRGISWRPGVDHRDPAPRPAEHEGCTQPGRSAADHHHVVERHFHERRVHGRRGT